MRRKIICLEGELQGSEVPISVDSSLLIGRDAKKVNLVFRDRTISRLHCKIENIEDEYYSITNYSSDCIETEDGRSVPCGGKVNLDIGTVLYIGQAGTKIQLN